MLQVYWLAIFWTTGYFMATVSPDSFYPEVAEVFENESVFFTLSHNSTKDETIFWNLQGGGVIVTSLKYSSARCNSTFVNIKEEPYEVSCNLSAITLKIKSVQRNEHGQTWICTVEGLSQRNRGQIYIKVPVNSVYITVNSMDVPEIIVQENIPITVQCRSSYCRPNATVMLQTDFGDETSNKTEYIYGNESLWRTETSFIFDANKRINNHTISCLAWNLPGKNATSKNVTFNVHYPPSHPPKIENLNNNASYNIMENTKGSLTCYIDESNPPANLSWFCENTDDSSFSGNKTHKTLFFNASRNTNAICTCSSLYNKTRKSSAVRFNILYEPDAIQTSLVHESGNETNIVPIISVIENSNLTFICSANGNPPPDTYVWLGVQESNTSKLAIHVAEKTNGNITCEASNKMMGSEENKIVVGKTSETYTLVVLFPPTLMISQQNYNILENDTFKANCSAIGGRTTSQVVHWNREQQPLINVSGGDLLILTTSRNYSGNFTCQLNYTLNATYGHDKSDVKMKNLLLNVMYPPEQFKSKLTLTGEIQYEYDDIKTAFSIIENNTLFIVCNATSNPIPKYLFWSGKRQNLSRELNFNLQRNLSGLYRCHANNIMNLTNGTILNVTHEQSYNITVLYPPELELNITSSYAIIENDYFAANCDAVNGMTTRQSVEWIPRLGTIGNQSSTLALGNVKRHMNGTYICLLNYTLNPTYGNGTSHSQDKELLLDVLYRPENISTNMTVDGVHHTNIPNDFSVIENTSLTFVFSAVGNPPPIKYHWSGVKYSDDKTLEFKATRELKGKLTCSAENIMNPTNRNQQTGLNNNTYEIDVLYAPSILQLQNYSVLEGNEFNATCKLQSGRTTNQSVIWLKNSSRASGSSNLHFQNTLKTMTGAYTCQLDFLMEPTYGEKVNETHTESFFLDVLFPPENMEVELTLEQHKYRNISKRLSVMENKTVVLICSACGNPLPFNFSWKGKITNDSAILHLTLTRSLAGNYTCFASNTMVLTYAVEKTQVGKASETYEFEVLYPPNIQQHKNYTVLEGANFRTTCKIEEGKTSGQSLIWLSDFKEDDNPSVLSILNVRRNYTGVYTCQLNFTMESTYGDVVNESKTMALFLDILYPPEKIVVSISVGSEIHFNIEKNITIIENGTNGVVLNCSADGNPKPTSVSWNGSDTKIMKLNLSRNIAGTYTCTAKNTMILTYPMETTQRWEFSENYSINVLYPPTLLQEKHGNKTKGANLVKNCIKSLGNVNTQTVSWLKGNTTVSNNGTLSKTNVTANDEGLYTCIVHVNMTPTYGNTTSVILNTTFYLYVDTASDHQTWISENTGGSTTVAVVSGILSAAFVIALIIVGFAIARKRRFVLFSRNKTSRKGNEYENVGFTHDPKQEKRLPDLPPPEEPEVEENVFTSNIAETEFYGPEENPYVNTTEVAEVLRISISELFTYVSNKSKKYFYEEFEKLPKGTVSTIPCTFARKPENVALNRYQGIYPYDHSRVHILEQPAFFINANYIDGYARPRQYIASLGPTERHTLGFTTFWNLIWYEKADVIVMLTNLSEPSGMKCEQYWPDYGKQMEVDNFLIQSETEEEAAEYTVRTFTLLKGEESRMVTQLHYTAWPDKTVPESVTSLIEFRQRVNAAPTRSLGPLIVHCSAGVGRTGTYIALDRLIEEGKSTDYVNVFECVNNMRKQRVNMVQTPEQYVYLHQALVYCIAFDIEPVTAKTIGEYIQTTSNNVFSQLYQQLKQTVEKESDEYIEAQNKHASFIDWNRRRADIPGDRHRVLLSLDKEFGQSNYINAMYFASFLRLDHFIIAQSPLPKTAEDFVGMLYQEKSACIVALDDYRQKGTNNAIYLPAENEQFTYGYFSISCLSVEAKPAYVVRKLRLKHKGKHEQGETIAYHFEFTAWKHDEKLPKDPKMFVEFVREIEDSAKKSTEENPHVVVHCMSGSERSGLFCAVSNLIQKIELEQQVSVMNMLRRVRERRRTAISSMEQLKFCYHAVNAFVKKTQHLSTRKKSSLMHYENSV